MSEFATKAVNSIRALAADMPTQANSGHPGAPMGMAPFAHVLWSKFLRFNPANHEWAGRDRFVLSNGHACALLYSMLYLTGYKEWSLDDLKAFRQWGSKTPGHPENHFPGVEVSTGPLGQGLSNAVGLAIAEAMAAARFNKPGFPIVDNYTYVFTGDGCLQEGITSEACSIAGHLGLGKLIVLYDDNKITIDGATSLSFTEDVPKRYEAYGWHTLTVENGDHNYDGIAEAIAAAKAVTDKPSLISVKTTIGWGSLKQGTHSVHGSPLTKDDLAQFKKKAGLSEQAFDVDPAVKAFYDRTAQGAEAEAAWVALFAAYRAQYPELAAEFERRKAGELPDGWEKALPEWKPSDASMATRRAGQLCINPLAKVLPELVGGSADLSPSCLTYLDCSTDFTKTDHAGRNIRFGVREHAMCAIVNGIAAYGLFIPYGSTFLNFIGYALGAVTLAALCEYRAIYVFTHDSIGLGEDGPTHQAVEKYHLCRDTPNLLFLRPADANETAGSWAAALKWKHGPVVLALSRQNLANLKGSSGAAVARGAYVLDEPADAAPASVVLVGTGSEVEICVAAAAKLAALGSAAGGVRARVVSMPSWELFEEQPQDYKESVFPAGVPVLSVEAGTIGGWSKYAHASVGMTTFGASAPAPVLYEKFGFTADNVATKAQQLIAFWRSAGSVPHLVKRPW